MNLHSNGIFFRFNTIRTLQDVELLKYVYKVYGFQTVSSPFSIKKSQDRIKQRGNQQSSFKIRLSIYQIGKIIFQLQYKLMKNQNTHNDNQLLFDYFNLGKKLKSPIHISPSKNTNRNTNSTFNNPILQPTQASVLTKNIVLKYYRKKRNINLREYKPVKTQPNQIQRGEGSNFVFSSFGITSMKFYNRAKQIKQSELLKKQRVSQTLQGQNQISLASNRHINSAKSCRTTFIGRVNGYPFSCEGVNQYDLKIRPFSSKIKRLKACESQSLRRDDQIKSETCEEFLIPAQTIKAKRIKHPYNTRISSALMSKQKLKQKYKIDRLDKKYYYTNQDQFKGWDFETETQTL